MGSAVNISVTTHCKHLCKYPVVYTDGKTRVEHNKRKHKKGEGLFYFDLKVLRFQLLYKERVELLSLSYNERVGLVT